MLENSNVSINLDNLQQADNTRQVAKTAQEVASILRDIDVNRISPIEAFDILNSLVKKVKENG